VEEQVRRGEVWWADLPAPRGSEPGDRRPVLIIQADEFNRSRISTVLALVLTTNLRLVDAPGNVLIPARAGGLPRDSVANVSQLITIDRAFLDERAGRLQGRYMAAVDAGLKLVLALN
jgi:mRNA interferase MazF